MKMTRRFKGRTDYDNMNATERGYEKAHLKAYLKGSPLFRYGKRPVYLEINGEKQKIGSEFIWHKVQVAYENPKT